VLERKSLVKRAGTLLDYSHSRTFIVSVENRHHAPLALSSPSIVQRLHSQKPRRAAQLFFNPQQLVVLGNPVGARGRSRLDLSAPVATAKSAMNVSSVSPERARSPTCIHCGVRDRLRPAFADRANLVELDQDRVGNSLLDALGEISCWCEDVVATN